MPGEPGEKGRKGDRGSGGGGGGMGGLMSPLIGGMGVGNHGDFPTAIIEGPPG